MDASQYKDYVLVVLFLKYISDKAKADKDYSLNIPEGIGERFYKGDYKEKHCSHKPERYKAVAVKTFSLLIRFFILLMAELGMHGGRWLYVRSLPYLLWREQILLRARCPTTQKTPLPSLQPWRQHWRQSWRQSWRQHWRQPWLQQKRQHWRQQRPHTA